MSCSRLLACGLIMAASASPAQTFRWVDENGVVSYSQTPPPSGTAETVKIRPIPQQDTEAAKARLNQLRQQLADREEDRQLARESQQKTAQESAKRQQNCQAARTNLRNLEGLGNRLLHTSNGEYVRLTEDERQTRMQTARENIKSYCTD